MAEQEGLDQLRGVVERRARSVPPPRRPREVDESTATPKPESRQPQPPEADVAGAEQRGSAGPKLAWESSTGVTPPTPAPALAPDLDLVPTPGQAERPTEVSESTEVSGPDRWPQPGDASVRPALTGTEATANLTLRIRQSLDLRLVELLHGLRREGVRSSKKELIEMCISELPLDPGEHLRRRLRAYRDIVPKEPL